jgi:hypothetical protein
VPRLRRPTWHSYIQLIPVVEDVLYVLIKDATRLDKYNDVRLRALRCDKNEDDHEEYEKTHLLQNQKKKLGDKKTGRKRKGFKSRLVRIKKYERPKME